MSNELTKDDVIQHKKAAIKSLNAVLEKYINDSNISHLKKANLISYWIESYSKYMQHEECFDPKRLISYKRGDIVKVDFGFNIGSEHGGLHYAVVLDNNNLHSSPVVTVIPLSSGTEDSVHNRDIYLGNELYTKMLSKHKILFESASQKTEQCTKLLRVLLSSKASEDVSSLIYDIENQQKEAFNDIHLLSKYKKEIDRMKHGSIAMMEQITTISKLRIYVPRKSHDLLYGISFGATAMDKINNHLKALYIR